MKTLQKWTFRVLCAAVVAVGVVFIIFDLHVVYDFAINVLPDDDALRMGLALAAVAVGVIGIGMTLINRTSNSRKIEFQSRHGYIVIELDSVQTSLQKAMSKLPEIKNISLRVFPADNDRKVRIVADAVVIKPPGAGIRETASNLEDKLADAAKRMLGVDDIASLDLNISRVLMNVKKEVDAAADSAKLLEHKKEQPAPVAAEPAKEPAPAEPKPAESKADDTKSAEGSNGEQASEGAESDKEGEPAKAFWR